LGKYVAENGLGIPGIEVISDLPTGLTQAYSLGPTPETIVLSPEGRVVALWEGALHGRSQIEAEKFFDVKLPGLIRE
jgi:hypothetical protein